MRDLSVDTLNPILKIYFICMNVPTLYFTLHESYSMKLRNRIAVKCMPCIKRQLHYVSCAHGYMSVSSRLRMLNGTLRFIIYRATLSKSRMRNV